MRSVFVDLARRRNADRRGGGVAHVTLTTQMGAATLRGEEEILRVHDALDELASHPQPAEASCELARARLALASRAEDWRRLEQCVPISAPGASPHQKWSSRWNAFRANGTVARSRGP